VWKRRGGVIGRRVKERVRIEGRIKGKESEKRKKESNGKESGICLNKFVSPNFTDDTVMAMERKIVKGRKRKIVMGRKTQKEK